SHLTACGRVAFFIFGSCDSRLFSSFNSFNYANEIKRIYIADIKRFSYCKAGSCPLSLHRCSDRDSG
ncbi:hypothetical protein, partial [Bacteroides acidifaciens]|uniref:hypothetical protein n=1 Tax=Bacteroides acidifaciens TaxID=85831 RepID=UPI0025A5A298